MKKVPCPDDVEDMKEAIHTLYDVFDELQLDDYFPQNVIGTVLMAKCIEIAIFRGMDLRQFLEICEVSYLRVEELIADTDNQNFNNDK